MRLVIALGGNALLKRGEALTEENQRRNMQAAAAALASVCEGHQVAIVHGNGPQVGLLALEAAAYDAVPPYPLDVLGAESQGMIGYVIAQELRNAAPSRLVASILTQTVVDGGDLAFARPTKPIGPVYRSVDEGRAGIGRDWSFAADGKGFRRVVPSPHPVEIVEMKEIAHLFDSGAITICCGGGGIPVLRDAAGHLHGIEAVIDKDLAAALLARQLKADRLIILTDVDAVYTGWGSPEQRALRELSAAEITGHEFAEGSMLPKVQAAAAFAGSTGNPAAIGALADLQAVMEGRAGTQVTG